MVIRLHHIHPQYHIRLPVQDNEQTRADRPVILFIANPLSSYKRYANRKFLTVPRAAPSAPASTPDPPVLSPDSSVHTEAGDLQTCSTPSVSAFVDSPENFTVFTKSTDIRFSFTARVAMNSHFKRLRQNALPSHPGSKAYTLFRKRVKYCHWPFPETKFQLFNHLPSDPPGTSALSPTYHVMLGLLHHRIRNRKVRPSPPALATMSKSQNPSMPSYMLIP